MIIASYTILLKVCSDYAEEYSVGAVNGEGESNDWIHIRSLVNGRCHHLHSTVQRKE